MHDEAKGDADPGRAKLEHAGVLSIFLAVFLAGASLAACASDEYQLTEIPDYQHLVGKKFSEAFPQPVRRGFMKLSETAEVEELEDRRPDGCATVFGVRKSDGVIVYWRVTPSPSVCKIRQSPLNR